MTFFSPLQNFVSTTARPVILFFPLLLLTATYHSCTLTDQSHYFQSSCEEASAVPETDSVIYHNTAASCLRQPVLADLFSISVIWFCL